ncbi:hypothetical protein DY245_28545, partial [Streptomyces inhibens]
MVLGQTQTAPVLQRPRQTEPFGRLGGDDDERIGVLAVAVEAGRAQPRLGQCPVDQGRESPGRTVEDEAADTVRRTLTVQHGERTVGEPGVEGGCVGGGARPARLARLARLGLLGGRAARRRCRHGAHRPGASRVGGSGGRLGRHRDGG